MKYDFKALIQENGLSQLYENFCQNSIELGVSLSNDKLSFSYHIQNEFGEFESYTDTFENYLRKILSQCLANYYKRVDSRIELLMTKEDKIHLCQELIDEMVFYLGNLEDRICYSQKELIKKSLFNGIQFIQKKYPSLYSQISMPSSLKEAVNYTKSEGVYGCILKTRQIKELAMELQGIGFLEEEKAIISNFLEWSIAETTTKFNFKIVLGLSVGKVCYVFEKMKLYYSNLTNKGIEDSAVFLHSKDKTIKADSLEVSLSKLKKKDNDFEEFSIEIDSMFNRFDEQLNS